MDIVFFGWHENTDPKMCPVGLIFPLSDVPLPTFAHLPDHRHSAQTNNATAPELSPKRVQRPSVMSDTEMEVR